MLLLKIKYETHLEVLKSKYKINDHLFFRFNVLQPFFEQLLKKTLYTFFVFYYLIDAVKIQFVTTLKCDASQINLRQRTRNKCD